MPSKQSTNILDAKSVTRKGRPPCKRKQGVVEKAVKKKREAVKKKSLSAKKADVSKEQVKKIRDIAAVNVGTTQESVLQVNVNNNGSQMRALMWPQMGALMWPNMMTHNFQNPTNLMPTTQSAIRGGPQSSFMGSHVQECEGVQPSYLQMLNGMNHEEE